MCIFVCAQMMVGLYMFQFIMMGLFGIKRFPWGLLLLPCIIATIAFHAAVLRLFRSSWTRMALRDARDLDAQEEQVWGARRTWHRASWRPMYDINLLRHEHHDARPQNSKMQDDTRHICSLQSALTWASTSCKRCSFYTCDHLS